MVTNKVSRCFLVTGLLLSLACLGCPSNGPQTGQGTVEIAGDGNEEDVVQGEQSVCLVKPVFMTDWHDEPKPMPFDQVLSVTLISYERQPQDEGVVIKRWAGDTSSEYKYVEKDRTKLKLSDFPDGVIPLKPGMYQFNHNSVYGTPPSGYYGESNFFEVKPGDETLEVKVPLMAAI